MSDTNYRIRIKIGAQDVEIEAQGDKTFVQEIFSEFQDKGTKMLPADVMKRLGEERKPGKPSKEKKQKEQKARAKRVPSRAPKFLVERRAAIDKVMTERIPEDPPYRAAIQGAKDLEHQCAHVLLLFLERYEIEGLSAAELERILVKRFSIPITADTIAKKLSKQPTHFDKVKHPRHAALTLYQLTAGGIEDSRRSLEVDSGRFQPKSPEELMPESDIS